MPKRDGVGHNVLGPDAQDQMRALEKRITRLLDNRDEINADIAEVFKEASDAGFHTPTLRKAIMRKRAMDKDEAGFKAAEKQLALYFSSLYQADLFESDGDGKVTTIDEARGARAAKPDKKAAKAPAEPDPLIA